MHTPQSMQINRLLFVETGTYNDLALRPYETHVNDQSLAMLREATLGGQRLQASAISGVAGTIVRPSATAVGTVSIANGFDTPRFRFLLEVEIKDFTGGSTIQYISGSTDHAELSLQTGQPDLNMRLRINNIVKTRRVVEHTPMGLATRETVSESSQILTGPYQASIASLANAAHTMRPEDVFGTIGLQVLDSSDTFDLRTTFAGGAKKSNRKNGVTTQYLSRMLTSQRNAMAKASYADDFTGQMDDAAGMVRESLMAADPFMNHLQRHTGFAHGDEFTLGQLYDLQPGLANDDERVKVIRGRGVVAQGWQCHERGQSEHWGGTTSETLWATILAHSVPSIMLDLMLTKVTLTATNRTTDGSFVSQFIAEPGGFTRGVDLSQALTLFLARLESEVLGCLTQNGHIDVALTMNIQVLGESVIDISLMGGPTIRYVMPSFCDALAAPVITNNIQNLHTIASDISSLADAVGMSFGNPGDAGNFNPLSGSFNGHSSLV